MAAPLGTITLAAHAILLQTVAVANVSVSSNNYATNIIGTIVQVGASVTGYSNGDIIAVTNALTTYTNNGNPYYIVFDTDILFKYIPPS